ncbi:MotA/TolQ/ExbB proton channel family protein [Sulfurimonas gotlandica]|nr:MotA/TolQ/ExbB proton channel family protein [Sulfurimonas gotlandica]
MTPQEQFTSLSIVLGKGRGCSLRLLWLLSIPIFLFLFAIAGYLKLINFHVEIHSVLMIGAIFIIYIFFMKHNAYYAACKLRRNFDEVKANLLKYINKNLLSIAGIEKANAPLDDFLNEEAKKMRNENFSSIAAGIFPTLGILGTFISIAISMPDFSSQTSQVLEEEISKLLGGVGTAFYVSIYGIFLSIWWIFFEKSGLSRFQKDSNIIKEATHDYFWQKEEIEQTYFRKSMENFEKLNSVFDTFASGAFVENLNKALAQRMNIFEQIIEHEQKATGKVSKLLEDGALRLETIANQQKEIALVFQTTIDKFENFAASVNNQHNSLDKAHNALSSEFSRAVMIAEVLSENSVKLNEALSNINVQNVQNLYSGVINNIESMKKEIDQIGSSFDDRINQFDDKFLNKLKNTLKLIDSETATIVSQISQLKSDGN